MPLLAALQPGRTHLVTLAFAFVLGSFFLSELPGIRNMLDRYLMDPWAAIAGSLALLFRPYRDSRNFGSHSDSDIGNRRRPDDGPRFQPDSRQESDARREANTDARDLSRIGR